MKTIQLNQSFVETKNVRNFAVMMDALAMASGEGRLGCLPGTPGIGKTKTAQIYAAQHGCVYLRVASIWKRSELDFIQALAYRLDMATPPSRKGRCYAEVVDRLVGTERPVFIDEMQRLPKDFMNIVLDLSDATSCPFILIGEEELKGMMQENKRVWSRTYQLLEFAPLAVSDVMLYAMKGAELKLQPEVAGILHKSCGGDFRVLRRDMIALVQFINAQGPGPDGEFKVTEEMVRIAVDMGLRGARSQNGAGKGGAR